MRSYTSSSEEGTVEERPVTTDPDVAFGSNAVRLSPAEWVVALLLAGALLYAIPHVWERAEPVPIATDHRIPFRLSEDYWMYDRACRAVCGRGRILVVGDSVVWGHYVAPEETFTHHLSALAGEARARHRIEA